MNRRVGASGKQLDIDIAPAGEQDPIYVGIDCVPLPIGEERGDHYRNPAGCEYGLDVATGHEADLPVIGPALGSACYADNGRHVSCREYRTGAPLGAPLPLTSIRIFA